jgi:hypothetical protein
MMHTLKSTTAHEMKSFSELYFIYLSIFYFYYYYRLLKTQTWQKYQILKVTKFGFKAKIKIRLDDPLLNTMTLILQHMDI